MWCWRVGGKDGWVQGCVMLGIQGCGVLVGEYRGVWCWWVSTGVCGAGG